DAERDCPPQLRIVEWRRRAVDQEVDVDAAGVHFANRFRYLALQILGQRDRQRAAEGQVVFAGDKGEDRGRPVFDDRVLDTVEIRLAGLPIIRVAGKLDVLVWLELDEFERAGADRALPHVARRDV